MKRHGRLWERIVDWENLEIAATKARRGKRHAGNAQRFWFSRERELMSIHDALENGSWRPGPFRTHWIQRPKPRLISAAPFRDRVVHHAVMNVLEPILDRRFHADSYACRRGKGTHAAARRVQHWMRRRTYVLQCDIAKFFPSIDHDILTAEFRRVIKDQRLLHLLEVIVAGSNPQEHVVAWYPGDELFTPVERRRGLPIGNLTSQWFANWMLDAFDHHITASLGFGAYVRYCDDFVVFADSKSALHHLKAEIMQVLAARRLGLNENKCQVRPTFDGLTFVGYRIRPHTMQVRVANVRAFRRRVAWMRREFACHRLDFPEVKQRLNGWIGHARQADSERLLNRLSHEWCFTRGGAEHSSCSSRRVVEQQPGQPPVCEPQQEHPGQPQQQQRVPSGPALPGFGLLCSRDPESRSSRRARA